MLFCCVLNLNCLNIKKKNERMKIKMKLLGLPMAINLMLPLSNKKEKSQILKLGRRTKQVRNGKEISTQLSI